MIRQGTSAMLDLKPQVRISGAPTLTRMLHPWCLSEVPASQREFLESLRSNIAILNRLNKPCQKCSALRAVLVHPSTSGYISLELATPLFHFVFHEQTSTVKAMWGGKILRYSLNSNAFSTG